MPDVTPPPVPTETPPPPTHAELLDQPSSWRSDLVTATLFLTRLPLPAIVRAHHGDLARALRAFPLVGAVIGLAAALIFWLGGLLGLAPLVAALVAIAATTALTGALHEDGLADCADGFGGGRDRDTKLAIMRDSRIGTYGVLALVLAVALKAAALADFSAGDACAALVAAHAASRGAMPLLMALLEPARADGLAASLGRPSELVLAQAVILGVLLCGLTAGPFAGIVALSFAALALAGLETLARRQIGGYTGDVLGAAQQVTEIAILLALSAVW